MRAAPLVERLDRAAEREETLVDLATLFLLTLSRVRVVHSLVAREIDEVERSDQDGRVDVLLRVVDAGDVALLTFNDQTEQAMGAAGATIHVGVCYVALLLAHI